LVAQRGELLATKAADLRVTQPRKIVLGPVSTTKQIVASQTAVRAGQRQQIGFPRDVIQTVTPELTMSHFDWQATPDGGQVAAVSFTSSGALAVRLGLVVSQLPASARLKVYGRDANDVTSVSGAQVLESLAQNTQGPVTAIGNANAARTYWTHDVDGDQVNLEVELPAGVATQSVAVSIPQLSHLFVAPKSALIQAGSGAGTGLNAKAVASCETDINCTTGYATEGNATARYTFSGTDGSTYLCTGTLMADRARSATPYFLTANHCVNLASEAASITSYWFYKSASCNATALSSAMKSVRGGAALLYVSDNSDTAFMRLNTAPPAGTSFAGWDSAAPATGMSIVGVHHPEGGLQKISYGSTQSFASCTGSSLSDSFSCAPSTVALSKYLVVGWNRGVTEFGSSGSGLFKTVGTSTYLIGQLYGGASSCTNLTGTDSYGRFDVAYKSALSQWLDPTACVTP
jgi:lysyl endopeptidase